MKYLSGAYLLTWVRVRESRVGPKQDEKRGQHDTGTQHGGGCQVQGHAGGAEGHEACLPLLRCHGAARLHGATPARLLVDHARTNFLSQVRSFLSPEVVH